MKLCYSRCQRFPSRDAASIRTTECQSNPQDARSKYRRDGPLYGDGVLAAAVAADVERVVVQQRDAWIEDDDDTV